MGVRITTDDATVTIAGEPEATLAERLLDGAYSLLNQESALTWLILVFLRLLESGEDLTPQTLLDDRIPIPSNKRFINPKSLGQRRYVQAIRHHDIVMALVLQGPARLTWRWPWRLPVWIERV